MVKLLTRLLQNYSRPYLTDAEMEVLLKNSTSDSRYGKVKRLLAQGQLLHIRRGLYCLAEGAGHLKPHPFELAQYIYGPSYISLESALSFHNLIPERVYTVTSVTSKRTAEFDTPLGQFSYSHLPSENFYVEVELIKENDYRFFIAKPWKAICDYVFCYKKAWHSVEPLLTSLRIDREALPPLHETTVQLLNDYYHHSRIHRFLKGVQKDLK